MVKRHPMIAFFVLAYAFSWWPWILSALGVIDNPIAGFGPFLAALLVLGLTEGRRGIVALLRRMVQWRVGPGWYAVALLLPAAVAGLASVLNVTLGAESPTPAELGRWTGIFGTFAILLLVPGFGGAWEEPGWRGYAVPRLQARWSALTSGLVLGVLIAGWHLPLIAVGQVHYADVVSIMGATDRDQLAVQPRPRQRVVDHDPARREQRDLRQLLLADVHRRRLGPSGLAAGSDLVRTGRRRRPGRRAS